MTENPNLILLEYPIDIKSDTGSVMTMTSITLRRMKAKDLKHIKSNDIENNPYVMIPLIAALADIPVTTADEIDIVDLNKIIKDRLLNLLGGFPGTGSKSSGESQESITSPPATSGT